MHDMKERMPADATFHRPAWQKSAEAGGVSGNPARAYQSAADYIYIYICI